MSDLANRAANILQATTRGGPASSFPMADGLPAPPSAASNGDTTALLTDVRMALARVVHDVNNPLSIISGNAQLLCELARMMDLDPDLAKPIADIEEASRVLAERIATLAALKEQVRAALDEADVL